MRRYQKSKQMINEQDNNIGLNISVVIPAYNSQDYIADSIKSVFNQTWKPKEIIVVDDGSTDKTADVVNSLDPPDGLKIVLLRQENSGPSAARNRGLKAANGNWIAFLDSDDIWKPEKLAAQVSCLSDNPESGLIFGDMELLRPGKDMIASAFQKFGFPDGCQNREWKNAFERLLERNPIPTSSVLVRKKAIQLAGYFDEQLWHGEDYDLWLRLALSVKITCIPDVVLTKRLLGNNLSEDEAKFFYSKFYILKKIIRQYDLSLSCRERIKQIFLAESKQLSYLYYIKGLYALSFKSYMRFVFFWCRIRTGMNIA